MKQTLREKLTITRALFPPGIFLLGFNMGTGSVTAMSIGEEHPAEALQSPFEDLYRDEAVTARFENRHTPEVNGSREDVERARHQNQGGTVPSVYAGSLNTTDTVSF